MLFALFAALVVSSGGSMAPAAASENYWGLSPGDPVLVRTRDAIDAVGRVVEASDDEILIETAEGQRIRFVAAEIDSVRRIEPQPPTEMPSCCLAPAWSLDPKLPDVWMQVGGGSAEISTGDAGISNDAELGFGWRRLDFVAVRRMWYQGARSGDYPREHLQETAVLYGRRAQTGHVIALAAAGVGWTRRRRNTSASSTTGRSPRPPRCRRSSPGDSRDSDSRSASTRRRWAWSAPAR